MCGYLKAELPPLELSLSFPKLSLALSCTLLEVSKLELEITFAWIPFSFCFVDGFECSFCEVWASFELTGRSRQT